MPTPITNHLADVDGILCIVMKGTVWAAPRYYLIHFATDFETVAFCRTHRITPEQLAEVEIIRSGSRRFRVVRIAGSYPRVSTVILIAGDSDTSAIKVGYEDIPCPQVGKESKLQWRHGRWHKSGPSGKWLAIDLPGEKSSFKEEARRA